MVVEWFMMCDVCKDGSSIIPTAFSKTEKKQTGLNTFWGVMLLC